jgi:Histone chaperone Rttp106-like
VPEKAKKQHNFVIMPKGGNGLSTAPNTAECIVWTVNESPASEEGKTDAEPANTARFLSAQLARFGKEVVFPDENEFKSGMPTVRKGDKAYHVKAHRGSKDGYLFFLPGGIIWVFKKPLLFLPFSAITSIAYSSVLQRTFNLNITASFTGPDGSTKDQDIEFSMIDQADYAGINEYVQRHGLNDASLAAERRAKVYNVNKPKGDADANGHAEAAGEGGESELQKAEQMLQDEEDEQEEDYVDEESEEGSSEDDDYGEGTYEHGDDDDDEGAFEEAEEFEGEEGGYEDEEG